MIRKMILGAAVAVALTMTTGHAANPVDPSGLIAATRAGVAPSIVVTRGVQLTFVNLDPLWKHGILSVDTLKGGRPLFSTDTFGVPFGGTSLVRGVAKLAPGFYEFYSPRHESVHGTLRVL